MTNEAALQLIISVFSVIGVIWRVAGVKADLEARIADFKTQAFQNTDFLKDSMDKQMNSLDKRLDLFVQDSLAARERITYQLDGQGARLGTEVENLKKRMSGAIVFERVENKLDKLLDENKKAS